MLITIGTALGAQARGDGGGGPPGFVTVDAMQGERPVFDSGAARGEASASVPLSGTATPDAAIELRVVTASGQEATPWAALTADAAGTWSAAVDVPLTPDWLVAQARLAGASSAGAQGSPFAVGHVVAIWQQSEHHHMVLAAHDTGPAPGIAGPGDVEMWVDPDRAAAPERIVAEPGAPGLTAAMAAMADTLTQARPGEKFCIIWHVEGGTSWSELLDDDDPGRSWATDLALHQAASRGGLTEVGLAWASWYASPRGRSTGYVASLLPALFGVDADGNVADEPGHEHRMDELYGPGIRWLFAEPHRFEGDIASGATIQGCRESVRGGPALAGAGGRILPPGIALTGYLNGEEDGAGGWADWTHPAKDDPDGLERLARLTAGSILMGMGLIARDVPAFDSAEWQPDGSYVEIWDSAGPLTTERRARGLPAIEPAAHRTEVMGFGVDGAPAERADIVAGRVRVFPPAGQSFGPASYLRFGEGGGTGGSAEVEGDLRAGIHLNLPARDAGVPGVPLVAALPMPDPAILASTIPGAPPLLHRSASGPGFRQDLAASGPTSIGAGRQALSLTFDIEVPDDPASKIANVEVLEITGLQLVVRLDLRPTKRGGLVEAKNQPRETLASAPIPNGSLEYGARHSLSAVMAFPTAVQDGFFRLQLDGTVLADLSVPAGTVPGPFEASRSIRFVNEAGVPLGFGPLRLWWEAAPGGALPARAPDIEIGPDLASVNAHPWKQGPDAT